MSVFLLSHQLRANRHNPNPLSGARKPNNSPLPARRSFSVGGIRGFGGCANPLASILQPMVSSGV